MITTLKPNEIFVFGSNTTGRHGAGAARQAHDSFGAEYGVGEGITGQSYAFPTLNGDLQKRTIEELEVSRDKLYAIANSHKHLTFLLTRVGEGLAGYTRDEMDSVFGELPDNIKRV